jgi:PIN domain nuclease of toxin-antitoxin system
MNDRLTHAPKSSRAVSMNNPTPHQGTQSVVFDAEPIIIWIDDDTGADVVEQHLTDTYFDNIETYISEVNLAEVHYNCAGRNSRAYGDKKTRELQQFGVQVVPTTATWKRAALFKDEYTPNFPLGDAFALATAAEQNVPLLVGDDTDWDDPLDDGEDIIRVS